MGLEHPRRVVHHLGPERQLARDVELPRMDQQRNVSTIRQRRMPLGGRALDIDKARMRVLRVEDRVLVALRERELQVELDRRVGRAQKVEVAHGVGTHPVDQLVQWDETARALGHLALFQVDHLVQDDHQPFSIDSERSRGGLQAIDVAVMVGGPHFDDPLEMPALEPAQEIAEVGREIGRLAVGADDDAVLLVRPDLLAQAVLLFRGRTKPQGAIAFLEKA